MKKVKLTRGVRNQNPGNIRYNADNKWQGQISPENGFCRFSSFFWGVRAIFVLLIRTYYRKYGYTKLGALIRRYAPPCENHTDKYIDFVCQQTGLDADKELAGLDANQWVSIVQAICKYESGYKLETEMALSAFASAESV